MKTFEGRFVPALYQPPSPWFPGGKLETLLTPALQTQMGGHGGFLPGSGADLSFQGDLVDDKFAPALMNRGDSQGDNLPGQDVKRRWDCPNWMDPRLKGTAGYYPHALASYYHWRGLQHRPFPEDGFLFGDSGGFTVMTGDVSIDPRDVIDWQVKNCTVGAILDVPPIDKHGDKMYEEGLERTCKNIRVALPRYEKHLAEKGKYRWWGVVHGWTVDELDRWWATVSKIYPFTGEGEGWAFKPRPNITSRTTARVLHFIKQHDEIKRAHLLMTTGVDAVATLLCLGPEAGLEFASYDSTTFTLMATNRSLIDPTEDGLAWEMTRELKEDRRQRSRLQKHCQCFSCEQLRGDIERYPDLLPNNEGWTGYWVFRFAYHNLLSQLQVFGNLRKLIQQDGSERALETVLGKKDAGAALRAFEGREAFKDESGSSRGLLDLI